jgi:hypothetical protein
MSALGGQSGGHGTVVRAARRASIANATALGATTRTTGCTANREHEDSRSITGRAPRGKFSRTQRPWVEISSPAAPTSARGQVGPPRAAIPRAAGASAEHPRVAIARAARKSRRRFRKTQNQGMLVDPVVNRMLCT